MKKGLLDNILGFAAVPYHAAGNSEYQASVAVKEGLQGAGVARLQTSHEVFIARDAMVGHVRSMDRPGTGNVRYDGKSKPASWRPRTHK
jgi:hypothetical protein